MGSWKVALRIGPRVIASSPTPVARLSNSMLPRVCSTAFDQSASYTQRQCERQAATVVATTLDLTPPAYSHISPAFSTSLYATSHRVVSEQASFFQQLDTVLEKSGVRIYGYALARNSDSRSQLAEPFGSLRCIPALRSTIRLPGAFETEDFTMEMDSVKRKRKRKMNKHKHRKLRRRLRKSGK